MFQAAPDDEEGYPTWKKGERTLVTVEDWLTFIGLNQYTSLFMEHGYDNLSFIGDDIISTPKDLADIGITDDQNVAHLLKSLEAKGRCAGETF